MRRVALVASAGTAVALAAAACTGGGGGDKGLAPADGRITTGNYAFTSVTVANDACALEAFGLAPAVGDAIRLTVDGNTITAGPAQIFLTEDGTLSGTYESGVIDIDETVQFDWNNSSLALDCVEDDRYLLEGRTETDTSVVDGTLREEFTVASGDACDEVYQQISDAIGQEVSLPCESTIQFELAKFVSVTGTLTTASGMTAIGVTPTSGSAFTGTDFRINFTLGSGSPVAASGQDYDCWAPDPPDYPEYEIISTDSTTYAITIRVPPAMWSAGTKAVTASNGVTVAVATVEGGGTSTGGGTLNLISAPTSTTGACSFSLGGVPLAGEIAPPTTAAGSAYAPLVPKVERTKRKQVGLKTR